MLVNLFPWQMGGEDPLTAGFSPLPAHVDAGTGTACGNEGCRAAVGVTWHSTEGESATPRSEAGTSFCHHYSGRPLLHSFLDVSSAYMVPSKASLTVLMNA